MLRKFQSEYLNCGVSLDGPTLTLQGSTRTSNKKQESRWPKFPVSRNSVILTTTPFCWAERDSRMEKTPPPTDTSRHMPHFASPPQKDPRGCMMRTPFVVRPSISRFSCHFVAFSCKEEVQDYNDAQLTHLPAVSFIRLSQSTDSSLCSCLANLTSIYENQRFITSSQNTGTSHKHVQSNVNFHYTLHHQDISGLIFSSLPSINRNFNKLSR